MTIFLTKFYLKEIVFMLVKEIEYMEVEDITLALHFWLPKKAKAVLFYFHGMQSNGGWLFETGSVLASSSIAVYALDRRGSGLSGGLREDIPSHETLFNDYLSVLQKIKQRHTGAPIILMGQSLGGSILAGLLAWKKFNVTCDAVIFCAPALGQINTNTSKLSDISAIKYDDISSTPVNLADRDYTDDDCYLNFIKNDKHCNRKITNRARKVLLDIENIYYKRKNIIEDMPTIFICSENDPIINFQVAKGIYKNLTGKNGKIIILPAKKHYLEFSNVRSDLYKLIIEYCLNQRKMGL